jgi:hypothetical protein
MVRDGVLVYIYTVRGSDSEVAEPMGREVAVRGGWMHNRLWRGEIVSFCQFSDRNCIRMFLLLCARYLVRELPYLLA